MNRKKCRTLGPKTRLLATYIEVAATEARNGQLLIPYRKLRTFSRLFTATWVRKNIKTVESQLRAKKLFLALVNKDAFDKHRGILAAPTDNTDAARTFVEFGCYKPLVGIYVSKNSNGAVFGAYSLLRKDNADVILDKYVGIVKQAHQLGQFAPATLAASPELKQLVTNG